MHLYLVYEYEDDYDEDIPIILGPLDFVEQVWL